VRPQRTTLSPESDCYNMNKVATLHDSFKWQTLVRTIEPAMLFNLE